MSFSKAILIIITINLLPGELEDDLLFDNWLSLEKEINIDTQRRELIAIRGEEIQYKCLCLDGHWPFNFKARHVTAT